MTKLEKYKILKNILDIKYKGIELNKVMAVDIWNIANESRKYSLKHLLYYFLAINIETIKTGSKLFATFGRYKRIDHLELYNTIISKLKGLECSANNLMNISDKFRFPSFYNFSSFIKTYSRLKGTNLSIKQKLILASKTIYYINTIDSLSKIDFSFVKIYLAFCGTLDLENLLTQHLNNLNIKTYSLQHGLYFIYQKDIPIDCVNYENFESNFLLCWGNYTVEEYNKYGIPQRQLLVAGYPKETSREPIKNNNNYKRCLVLLTRTVYEYANKNLIELLTEYSKKTNIQFSFKLHPSLDNMYYEELTKSQHNFNILDNSKTLLSYLDNRDFDFAITINTTSYYEAIIKGIPSLQYNDGSYDDMYGCDKSFSTIEELDSILQDIKGKSAFIYQNQIDEMLKYTMGLGTDKYYQIIANEINS